MSDVVGFVNVKLLLFCYVEVDSILVCCNNKHCSLCVHPEELRLPFKGFIVCVEWLYFFSFVVESKNHVFSSKENSVC